jgi:hypothetical protein
VSRRGKNKGGEGEKGAHKEDVYTTGASAACMAVGDFHSHNNETDWRHHPKDVLESRLATIFKHLAQPPHMCPVFCAVCYFLGDECHLLHIVESFRVPPMKEQVPSNLLAHKPSEASLRADSESSEDAENPGLSAHPRKRCWVL